MPIGGVAAIEKKSVPIGSFALVKAVTSPGKFSRKPYSWRQCLLNIASALLILLLLFFVLVFMKAFYDGEFSSVETFHQYICKYGSFGPLLLTAFQAIQVIIPILPGFLGCIAGSVMFGPAVGFWCNYIGIGGGSIIAFLLARRFGMPLVEALFPPGKYHKWDRWISKSKSYTAFLFMAMLLPLFPDDYLCYLTGVSKMATRKFVWIIILGKPWCILAYSLGFSLIK